MSHYPDGSPCLALPVPETEGGRFLSVGWLSSAHPYPTGMVQESFFTLLCEHVASRWQPSFAVGGKHDCDLCQFGRPTTLHGGHEFSSASGAELFIPTGSVIWVAPVNIVHYIAAHHYLPPAEFIAAVEACPQQRNIPYLQRLLQSGGGSLMRSS